MQSTLRVTFTALAVLLSATEAMAQVEVQHAWARATVPGQRTSGAFMILTAAQGGRLVGARSPVAGAVEIHETRMEQNVARMRRAAAIELPAGKPVELKPGGYHVMLLDLKRMLKTGEAIALTLVIEGNGGKPSSVEVKVEVRPLAAGSHAHHH